MHEIAKDVAVIPMAMVNAYLVGDAGSWVLIDTGTPGNAGKIKESAEARFGSNARPRGIVLTHGHFDHSSSAAELGELWGVKVYAHRLEHPYLTGKSTYPPMDPTAPGFFSALSRVFPSKTAHLAHLLEDLHGSLPSLGIQDWEAVDTPGHSPGHVSFYRRNDRTLLAGDAVTTVNVDNFFDLVRKRRQVCRPPAPATPDWDRAYASVRKLASLRPELIAAGHGVPMQHAAQQLEDLAGHFPFPAYGRYAKQAARMGEDGITYLPPQPIDYVPRVAAGMAVAMGLMAAGIALQRSSQSDE